VKRHQTRSALSLRTRQRPLVHPVRWNDLQPMIAIGFGIGCAGSCVIRSNAIVRYVSVLAQRKALVWRASIKNKKRQKLAVHARFAMFSGSGLCAVM
jgi:hypothetical protein